MLDGTDPFTDFMQKHIETCLENTWGRTNLDGSFIYSDHIFKDTQAEQYMRLLTPLKQMSHDTKVMGSQINFSRNNIEAFMSLLQMSVDLVCEGFDSVVWGCRVCFHCSQLPHAWCLVHTSLTGRCHILSNALHIHKDYLMKQTYIRRHIAVVREAII